MFRNTRLFGEDATRGSAFIRTISHLVLLGILGTASALACTTTWTDGNGSWNNAANWDNGIPTNASDACVIDGTSTVTLSGTGNTSTLTLASGNTVAVGGNTLNIAGASVSNAGLITVNDGNLTLANNVTFSGGGTVSLSSDVFVNQASGGLKLTNADNLIEGTGQLGQNGLALDNQASGTVSANTNGGTLFLNGGGAVSNEGLLTATNNGLLQINNSVTNTGGNITANGGTVTFGGGTITGGTLNTLNSGSMNGGTATLVGVTISSGSTFNVSNQTFITGTITNNGTITVPDTNLTVAGGDVTLQGGGTVSMTNNAFLNQASGGLTLHNVNNLIEGTGQVGQNGLALDNQAAGVVNANISGGVLSLNGGGAVTNAGLLEATNGGILQINNNVTNTGANITANGGTVDFGSGTITGGTLNTLNAGAMNGGTATLVGVTISSGSVLNISQQNFFEGTITNNGTITNPNNTLTIAGGDVTLQGGGTVSMTNNAFLNQASGGLTLHNVNNLIEGAGQIGQNGLALDNQAAGVVNANISGDLLSLNGGGTVTNAGLLEATNGGILQINNNVTNTGANITANGGTVDFGSGTITGGTLNTLNGGTMNGGTATLVGVTISSGSVLNVSQQNFLEGTITNNGTITNPNNTLTIAGGDVTLQGGGTVSMTNDAFLNQSSGGLTLHNVNNLIEGTGQIGQNGMALDNQAAGVVNANVSGQQLSLNGGGTVTNAGLLEATNGGVLNINNTVNNTGNITGNGGTVNISSQINGGTLNTLNGGAMNGSGAVLNGVTISSGSTFNDAVQVFLEGTINNQGTITVPNNTLTIESGNVTLTGGGTVSLTQDAFFNQASGGLTLDNFNNTIQGTGQLGQDGMGINNEAAGVIKANVSGGILNINGGGLVTNAGTFEADAGATLHVSSPLNGTTYSAGTLETGTYKVVSTLASPGTIQIDTLGSTGGEITQSSANIILDGPNANPIVDLANKNALSAFQDNLAGGSFTVENGQQFSTTPTGNADFQNEGSVLVADATSGFTTTTNYTQDGAAATTQVDGTLTAGGGSVNIDAGTLLGSGTVVGNVLIGANGTLSPGDPGSPKAINITGNYSQAGTLDEMIAGMGIGQFGQTLVSGTASIGGSTLDVSLINGFTVGANTTDQFVILTASSPILGQFANVDFLNPGTDSLTVDYSHPDEVILDISGASSGGGGGTTATPEPVELLPLAGILFAVALWKARGKRAIAE